MGGRPFPESSAKALKPAAPPLHREVPLKRFIPKTAIHSDLHAKFSLLFNHLNGFLSMAYQARCWSRVNKFRSTPKLVFTNSAMFIYPLSTRGVLAEIHLA